MTMIKKILILNNNDYNEYINYNNITDYNVEYFDISIIEICDPDNNVSYFKNKHVNVLSTSFYDIKYECNLNNTFNNTIAIEIINFLINVSNKNNTLLIKCYAGVSRSAAIGIFAKTLFSISNDNILLSNKYIRPNKHVLNILKNMWKLHK